MPHSFKLSFRLTRPALLRAFCPPNPESINVWRCGAESVVKEAWSLTALGRQFAAIGFEPPTPKGHLERLDDLADALRAEIKRKAVEG